MEEELSKEIKLLFKDHKPPPIKLIESIHILGLSVSTLRSIINLGVLLEEQTHHDPEVILSYPPWDTSINAGELNVI